MSEYTQQAIDLLKKMKIGFTGHFVAHDSMPWDEPDPKRGGRRETRDIWRLTLRRGSRRYSVRFGQSIASRGETPTAYNMLTSITKNDPGSFSDFCGDFGYDEDSRKAERTYRAVLRDWRKVEAFFTADEINQLQEVN